MENKCNRVLAIPVLLIFLLLLPGVLSAARYVKVATIGAAPAIDTKQDPQLIVNEVIEFWKRELNQVLPDKPDLILLPEVCDMSVAGNEYLRVRKNQVLDYFASVAKSNNCYIAFGMLREESKDIWLNSCVVLDRNGSIAGIFDKNFPTIGEMENGIKASHVAPLIQCDFGSVAVAICFDLNFDELLDHYVKEKPDLILFSSMYHGGLVQSKWAFECRSHFAGSVYRGNPSEIRNPMGDVVATTTNYFNFTVADINLDCRLVHLDYNWEKLKSVKKKYGPSVTISDPGRVGAVLITSEDKDISVDKMISEFEIELLDDYFKRARNFRLKEGNMKP
jgi:hypothetical protein